MMDSLNKDACRCRLQRLALEDPGTIRQRMFGNDPPAVDC